MEIGKCWGLEWKSTVRALPLFSWKNYIWIWKNWSQIGEFAKMLIFLWKSQKELRFELRIFFCFLTSYVSLVRCGEWSGQIYVIVVQIIISKFIFKFSINCSDLAGVFSNLCPTKSSIFGRIFLPTFHPFLFFYFHISHSTKISFSKLYVFRIRNAASWRFLRKMLFQFMFRFMKTARRARSNDNFRKNHMFQYL